MTSLTPTTNTSLGVSPTGGGRMDGLRSHSPNPNHPRHVMDSSLFLLTPAARTPVSQPLQPALPKVLPSPSPSGRSDGVSGASPSMSHRSPAHAGSPLTSGIANNALSPSGSFLDPRGSASPSALDMMNGISGNTTPGFETLEEDIPDLGDVYRANCMPTAPAPDQTPSLATASNAYPPSPRLTISPHPGPVQNSPTVKIEHHSWDGEISHTSPYSHQQSSSSSSSGLGGGNHTIRRDEDGSWRGGLDPLTRGSDYLPLSLREQEFERLKREKNAEVEEWLNRSGGQFPRQSAIDGLSAPKSSHRRVRSVADFRAKQAVVNGRVVGPGESSASNATGAELDEDEDFYDDDDDSSVASVDSGWQEGSLDDLLEVEGNKELPPSEEDLSQAAKDDAERERRSRETDPAYLPKPNHFFNSRPWNDIVGPVTRGASMSYRNQPNSSNAAIQKFQKYAENIETASRVATFGSNMTKGRRNSAGDADKLPSKLKTLSFGNKDKDKDKDKNNVTPRRPSIWGGFRSNLKRSLSNSGDKEKEKEKERLQSPTDGKNGRFPAGRLGPNFGATSPTLTGKNGGTLGEVFDRVRRSRSKSDLQRGIVFGVVSSMMGPGLPNTPSPATSATPGRIEKRFTFGDETQKRGVEAARQLLSPNDAARNDEDEDMDDGDYSPESVRTSGGTKAQLPKHTIVPTIDGFEAHVRALNPSLSTKLVDRIAHEQYKRFKKLVDHRHKHIAALKTNHRCTNGDKCRPAFGAIGVSRGGVVSVPSHRRGNNSFDEDNDSSDDVLDGSPPDTSIAAAQFPPGVPTPPVLRLPAEFECPICFKTKKFTKPSDWTKHVHEDVQPFTCTFPDCTEPKSFKRKADWVRHENERHRHLEWWACNRLDCPHTCYRKDNFVQHLVREHKMVEPKVKSSVKGAGAAAKGNAAEVNKVWQIVEECHQETKQHPGEEKCRFCGNSCGSWKKLTVHLARHMEAISLPVLELVRDDAVVPAIRGARRGQKKEHAVARASAVANGGGNMNEIKGTSMPPGGVAANRGTAGQPGAVNPGMVAVQQYSLSLPQQQPSHNRSVSAPLASQPMEFEATTTTYQYPPPPQQQQQVYYDNCTMYPAASSQQQQQFFPPSVYAAGRYTTTTTTSGMTTPPMLAPQRMDIPVTVPGAYEYYPATGTETEMESYKLYRQ